MNRTIGVIEKNAIYITTPPIVVAANANTLVMKDRTSDRREFLARFIQNVGTNASFINVGADCDGTTNYIISLAAGQQFALQSCQRVNAFSVAGTTFAIIEIVTDDFTQQEQYYRGGNLIP
jgi:hypothetical protein